jgi:hypothetical protein
MTNNDKQCLFISILSIYLIIVSWNIMAIIT